MQDYETLEFKNISYKAGDELGRYDCYRGILCINDQNTVIECVNERYIKHVVNKDLVYIHGVLCYIYDVSSVCVIDKNSDYRPYHILCSYHELTGPDWDKAPIWADYLTQCPCTGNYIWHQEEPFNNKHVSNYNTGEFKCTRIAQFGFQYPKEQWASNKWENPKGIRAIY